MNFRHQNEGAVLKIQLITWGMKGIAFREKELNHRAKHFPNAGHFVAEEKPDELISEIRAIF